MYLLLLFLSSERETSFWSEQNGRLFSRSWAPFVPDVSVSLNFDFIRESIGIGEVEVGEATLDQLVHSKKRSRKKRRDSDPGSYEWRRHRSHSFDWTRVEWLEYETLMCEKGLPRSSVSSHRLSTLEEGRRNP